MSAIIFIVAFVSLVHFVENNIWKKHTLPKTAHWVLAWTDNNKFASTSCFRRTASLENTAPKHMGTINENNILELKEKIVVLEKSIQFLTAQIIELEETIIESSHPQEQTEIICVLLSLWLHSWYKFCSKTPHMKHKSREPKHKISCHECDMKFTLHIVWEVEEEIRDRGRGF